MPFTKQHSAYAWVVTCILFLINLTFHNLPLHSSYKIHQPITDYFLRLPYSELLEKRLFRSRANRRLVLLPFTRNARVLGVVDGCFLPFSHTSALEAAGLFRYFFRCNLRAAAHCSTSAVILFHPGWPFLYHADSSLKPFLSVALLASNHKRISDSGGRRHCCRSCGWAKTCSRKANLSWRLGIVADSGAKKVIFLRSGYIMYPPYTCIIYTYYRTMVWYGVNICK